MPSRLPRHFEALRTAALAYPETHEDLPWGHSAIKIKKKVFVFLNLDSDKNQLTVSTKLPHSSDAALLLPYASPTGYGLGRSGWVTATFAANDDVPVDMLRAWIAESFQSIAPAKLSKQLSATTNPAEPTPSKKNPAKQSSPAKKTATKKSSPAKKSSAKKSSAKKTTAKKTSPAKKTSSAKKTTAKKSSPRKTTAK